MREARTEVLVVGAGPVGLWTALLLARAGVQVTVVDQELRTTTRSYACALHPATLRMLQAAEILEPVLERGRQIKSLAFYDEKSRRAELSFSAVANDFPFLLILPQSELEGVLEDQLRRKGVEVQWKHRFDSLADEPESVATIVEELGGTGTGYIVPHWETVVKHRRPLIAQFVLGTDGYNSRVRQALGIEYDRFAGQTAFAAFEFETNEAIEPELRVVLGETTNVLWPLGGQKCRWTFQIIRSDLMREFPEKERRSARFTQSNVDERIRQYVEKVAGQRAPWFKAPVKEIAWCTEVAFEQRLVRQFGRNRCWLLGDAAHQTGPAGVQSMNAGFAEAQQLSGLLVKVLQRQASLGTLQQFETTQRANWERLLGLSGGLKAREDTDSWVSQHLAGILPCLPGSGPELVPLAAELKVNVG